MKIISEDDVVTLVMYVFFLHLFMANMGISMVLSE